jgi:hypothetical protein
MILTRSISSKLLLFGAALVSLTTLPAEDRFTASIQASPKTETTSIRIRIPKEAHSESIQSVYLQRKSATGLDLLVPIKASEDAEGYSIFLILPTSIADKSTIVVTHNRAIVPNADGSITLSAAVQGGESYEISLTQPKDPKSAAEQPAASPDPKPDDNEKPKPESEVRPR